MSQAALLNLSYNQVNVLEPLSKWRILDLTSVKEESNYLHTKNSLCKTVRKLESFGLINSFIDPFTKRKFIYLTKTGEFYVSPPGVTNGISHETVFHDAKVTEILRELLKRDCFKEAIVEHHLPPTDDFYRPDALITGTFKNPFRMAFELELTQKSKSRILKRFDYYLKSQAYEYVMYLFPRNRLLSTYHTLLEENFPPEAQKKIILCHNPTIVGQKFKLSGGVVFFKHRQGDFHDFF